jgi:hypothetical protein
LGLWLDGDEEKALDAASGEAEMLTKEERAWLLCRRIKPTMPPPAGSITIYTGDEATFVHKPLGGHWREGFVVLGRSTHPLRSYGEFYRVRWWTGHVEFDIGAFDLSYRGGVEVCLLTMFVAPFLHLRNWLSGKPGEIA